MDWSVWALFVLTEGALSATPGPAVLFVVSQGMRRGRSGAILSALGILTANALYFSLSGTGLGALLVASAPLFGVVKWAGAAYLLYLGANAILRPPYGTAVHGDAVDRRRWPIFGRGLAVQLSNPKALLFFVAILPQFIDRRGPIVFQILILGITSILLEYFILSAYGLAAARASRLVPGRRFAAATSRIGGLMLVGAALGLARIDR